MAPEDAQALIPGASKYVTFTWKRGFADVGKVIDLQMRR